MFLMYGPNTNHGSGSVPYTLECQFNYVIDAIRRMRAGGLRWIDLKPEVQARWRQEIDQRSRDTVWTTGGCTNWYTNAGRPQHEQLGWAVARVPPPHAAHQPGRLPGRARLMATRGAVVVTGSSTGIGRACAVALDREGFHVLAGVRKEADGESLKAAAAGLEPVIVDVTDAATIEALRAKVDAEHGGRLAGTGEQRRDLGCRSRSKESQSRSGGASSKST